MGKHNNKGSVYAQNKKVASSSKQQVVLPKRLTFTALEKLRIIDEVERSNDAQAVLQKYGTQPRSFQRWKCNRSKLEKQVAKGGTAKRTQSIDATIAILFYTFIIMYKSNDGLHNPLHKSHPTVSWHYLSINHTIETFPLASIYSFHTNYQHYLNCCMIY